MIKTLVVDFYKSQAAVARALNISEQAVSQWPEIIPKGAALELEKITNGSLKCDLSIYRQRKNKRRDDRRAEIHHNNCIKSTEVSHGLKNLHQTISKG